MLYHIITNNIFPIAIAILLAFDSFIVGNFIIKLLKIEIDSKLRSPLSLIVGYGLMAYIALCAAILNIISGATTLSILLLIAAIGYKCIVKIIVNVRKNVSGVIKWDWLDKTILFLILFAFLFYLSAALVPPYRIDALAYHLPFVTKIAEQGFSYIINSGGGGKFFINLPLMMETLYAFLFPLGSYSIVHLSHFSLVLSGLYLIYNFIKKFFSRTAALLSTAAIFTLYEFWVNAANAYVDAGMSIFEISGLLVMIYWLNNPKNSRILMLAGMFYGFAISIKYNAFYGLLFAGVIFLFGLLRNIRYDKNVVKKILLFIIPLLVCGGFWYVKNVITVGNPIYPFYLGHQGYNENEFYNLTQTIKLYELDRSIVNFLYVPFYFFLKSYYITVFIAFLAWPLLLLKIISYDISKRVAILTLSFYSLIYMLVWFFVATHQYKFFFVPMVLLLMLLGIFSCNIVNFLKKKFNKMIIILSIAACISLFLFFVIKEKNSYFVKVKQTDLLYNLGIYDKHDFYAQKNLAPVYDASLYLNESFGKENIFSVWSTPSFFLKNDIKLIHPHSLILNDQGIVINSSTVREFISKRNCNYVLIDKGEKYRSYNEKVRAMNKAYTPIRDGSAQIEDIIVEMVSGTVYSNEEIVIYKLLRSYE